jgi:hypothetical protein
VQRGLGLDPLREFRRVLDLFEAAGSGCRWWPTADAGQKKAAEAASHRFPCVGINYIGQIFQITPVPGIWSNGPLAGGPTKCVSEPRSRTAPKSGT